MQLLIIKYVRPNSVQEVVYGQVNVFCLHDILNIFIFALKELKTLIFYEMRPYVRMQFLPQARLCKTN